MTARARARVYVYVFGSLALAAGYALGTLVRYTWPMVFGF